MSVHPKVIATGIVCAAVLVGSFVYAERASLFGDNSGSGNPTDPNSAVVTGSNPDSATDGSDDWQKRLAENIAHSTSTVQILTSGNTSVAPDDNSLTAQLSRQFFALYLADQKNGVVIDDAESQRIATQALANVSLSSTAKQYGIKDIKISANSMEAAKTAYATALADALNKTSTKKATSELSIINTAINSENETDVAKIDPIITGYKNLIAATLKIQVPQTIVGQHVVFINAMSAVLSDLQYMRLLLQDPISGYIGFSNYQKDAVTLGIAFEKLEASLPQ